MLRLPSFEFVKPETVDEVVDALRSFGPQAMMVAGGTDVYPKMKRRQFTPAALVSLRRVAQLQGIEGDHASGIRIGAGTSLTAVAEHPEIRAHYGGLATAAGVVSSPVLRNMGTLGGNLCLDTRTDCNYQRT